jgi:predicted CXXCH cytochrome family protein
VANFLLSLTLSVALAAAAWQALAGNFVGSETCRDCHSEAFAAWRGSHHALAMQPATAQTVLGDFDDARVDYHGVSTRFFRDGEGFMVRTEGPDGRLQDFTVRYVFGVYPLQQLLLPLAGGRLQAFSIAWDARPASEGGQRWYHLYPDERIDHRDPLHWTGSYLNWNARCAGCHSTGVEKGYDAEQRHYRTRYSEVSVGCEACHGPGASHVTGMRRGEDARPMPTLTAGTQLATCARCHSRRSALGEFRHSTDLLDSHDLLRLLPPAYHADGQIRDEVFVHGSFLQSRMHQAGVVCGDCHEPHSASLRASGNALCAGCHAPDRYDSRAHHRHPDGAGAQCVNCHMPSTLYMGVDPRSDHSLRVPRPDLSLELGTPNACTDCHTDRDAHWALQALRDWDTKSVTATQRAHPGQVLTRLRAGDGAATPGVLALARDADVPALWRATALESLAWRDALTVAGPLLSAGDPLLRQSAVRSLSGAPLPERLRLLVPLLDEPVSAVRMALARVLADVPTEALPPEQRPALEALFRDYLRIQARHLDMPETQLDLGAFHSARAAPELAEAAYREALHLHPEHGPALHALGLLKVREGDLEAAIGLLGRAAAQESGDWRHRYVYAIALHDAGRGSDAVRELTALAEASPGLPPVLLALSEYTLELGDQAAARAWARKLVAADPDNTGFRRWLARLERAGHHSEANTR